MALLLVLYVLVSVLFTRVLGEHEAHTHFAYLPLVLAGLWWGRKGLVVAGLLTAMLLLFRLAGLTPFSWWADCEMVLSYFIVGSFFAAVGRRMERGRHALWSSRQKYSQLIEKSLAGILVYRDETVIFASSRLAQMLRCSPDELVGRPIWDLLAPDVRDEVKGLVKKREEGGFSDLHYESRLLCTDGDHLWVDVFSTRTTFDGETSVLVNLYDATARKAAESKEAELEDLAREQEEQLVHSARLAELGELAASVAHEVNQPLTGIRNYARNASYMLENEAGTREDLMGNLDRIAAQVDRAAHIVRLLQQLSRRSDRKMAPFDVNRAITETVELLSTQLRLAGVEVNLELDEDLPPFTGDRIRIEQVFLNLLNNALHAMEQVTQRQLTVRTSRQDDDLLVIEFEDTGVGFADDAVKKLFRPFFSTHSNGKGTGLGLSISQSVVEGHEGSIEATGEPGRGATFTVRLPTVRSRDEARGAAEGALAP